jgi:hypothetical protein
VQFPGLGAGGGTEPEVRDAFGTGRPTTKASPCGKHIISRVQVGAKVRSRKRGFLDVQSRIFRPDECLPGYSSTVSVSTVEHRAAAEWEISSRAYQPPVATALDRK